MLKFRGRLTYIFLAGLFVAGIFFISLARSVSAAGNYSKDSQGTLTASDWNNLPTDFLNTWQGDYLTGPLSINTTTLPTSGLLVNGPIVGDTFSGAYNGFLNAANISSGVFGENTGGGIYAFTGSVGIGTTTPTEALNIFGNIYTDLPASGAATFVENPTGATSAGKIQLGRTSEGWESISFDPTLGTNGNFVFTAPLKVAASSPGVTFYDPSDPNNTEKQRSIEYSATDLQLKIGDSFKTNFSTNTGMPPASKVFFQIGPNDLSGPSGQGIFIGANPPGGFTGDLLHFQVGGATRLRVTKFGDIISGGATMTTNGPIINTTQTWNNAAVDFTAWIMKITDTASLATSRLLDLQVNDVSKFVVRKDGAVGIGTSTPAASLDVNGLAKMRYFSITQPEDITNKSYVDSIVGAAIYTATSAITMWGGTTTNAIWNLNSGNVGVGTTSPATKFQVYGTGSIAASFMNGNVGIGTTSPTVNLHVVNSTASSFLSTLLKLQATGIDSSALMQIDRSASYRMAGINYSTLGVTDWFTGTYYGNGSAQSNFGIGTDYQLANQKMVISTGGNVGIGTTVPGNPLVVVGGRDTMVIGTTTASLPLRYANTNFKSLIIQGSTGVRGGVLDVKNIDGTLEGFFAAHNSGIEIGAHTNSPVLFFSNAEEKMRLTSVGNFGIGTSSPLSTLDINGLAKMQNYSITQPEDITNKSYVDSAIATATSTITLWGGTTGGNIWSLNSGNVGIGTTNPTAVLHVKNLATSGYTSTGYFEKGTGAGQDVSFQGNLGTLRLRTYNSAPNTALSGSAFFQESGTLAFINSAATGIYFATGNRYATPDMTINGSGNVGIGTTTPASRLSVVTNAQNDINLTLDSDASSSGAYINFNSRLSGVLKRAQIYSDWNGNIVINNGGANGSVSIGYAAVNSAKLYVSGNAVVGTNYSSNAAPTNGMLIEGSVGIATTSPLSTLDINGLAKMRNYSITMPEDLTNKSYVDSAIATATGTITLWGGTTGGNIWSLNSGNVGIGTTSPAQKLDVVGIVNSSIGYRIGNANATAGNYLRGNGSNFVASTIQVADVPTLNQNTTGYAANLNYEDNRIVIPNELAAAKLKFGFTTYDNNNSSPYADFLHLRSYIDSTGGADNLLVFNKTGLGMRLYQQLWSSSSTAYATFKDIVLAENTPVANYLTKYSSVGDNVSVTSSLIYDSGTNVGVNTSSPITTLDINGLAKMRNYSITLPEDITNKSYVDSAIATATGTITLWGGTTGGNIWSLNSGNVGIGTTNPSQKLEVSGNIVVSGSNYVSANSIIGTSGVQSPLFFNTSDANTVITTRTATKDIVFKLNQGTGTEIIRLTSGGNVGIGTTSPQNKVAIHKDITSNSLNGDYQLSLRGSSNSQKMIGIGYDTTNNFAYINAGIQGSSWSPITLNSGGGGVTIGTTSMYANVAALQVNGAKSNQNKGIVGVMDNTSFAAGVGGRIIFGGKYNSAGAEILFSSIEGVKENATDGNYAGALVLGTVPNSGNLVERMRITSTGNVGINTTTPAVTLDINGLAKMRNYSITMPEDITNKSYVDSAIATATGTITLWGGTTGGNIWSLNSANVGIGTINPIAKLQLNNNWTSNPGGTNTIYLANSGFTSNNRSPEQIITTNSADLTPGSNIGLALHNSNTTAGAYAPLLVFSKTESDGTAYNSSMAAIGAKSVTGNGSGGNYIDGELMFYTAPTSGLGLLERMRISQSGNVGIGTTDPNVLLEISKSTAPTLRISNMKDGTFVQDEVIGTLGFYSGDITSGPIVTAEINQISDYAGSHGGIRGGLQFKNFDSNTGLLSETMRIASTGKVGIGTTSPAAKLAVNGDAAFNSGASGFAIGNVAGFNRLITYPSGPTFRFFTGAGAYASFGVASLSIGGSYAATSSSLNGMIVEGNVGIGTSSPVTTLDINGLAKMRNYSITMPEDLTNKSYVDSAIATATGTITLWGGTTGGNIWSLNSANVGVGTTSSAYKLGVNGTFRAVASSSSIILDSDGNVMIGI